VETSSPLLDASNALDSDILLGFVKSNKNAHSAPKTTTGKNVETNTLYAAPTALKPTPTYTMKTRKQTLIIASSAKSAPSCKG